MHICIDGYLHMVSARKFRGVSREQVTKATQSVTNCSNKPANASEECSPTFILYHNTLHVGVDFLSIYLLYRILGRGLKIFLEGWTFCLGAYS